MSAGPSGLAVFFGGFDMSHKPGHDVVVKVGLTADQYLHLVRFADDDDVTQSAFMRRLLIERIRIAANVAAQSSSETMTSPALDRA